MSAFLSAKTDRINPTSLAIRVVMVICGVGLAIVPSPVHALWAVLTIAAGLGCAVMPRRIGALVPSVFFLAGWLAAGGWHASPDPTLTVVAAALLYVLHRAVALAVLLPVTATVDRGVLRRCAWRALPALGAAAVVIVLDLLLGSTRGSPVAEAVALVAVLVITGLALRPVLFPRSVGPDV